MTYTLKEIKQKIKRGENIHIDDMDITEQNVTDIVVLIVKDIFNTENHDSFINVATKELQDRFSLPCYLIDSSIESVIAPHFRFQFVKYLKLAVENNENIENIEKEQFIKSFIDIFTASFKLTLAQVDTYHLKQKIVEYFPSDDFHSKLSRKKRDDIAKNRFQRDLRKLDDALIAGKRVIDNKDSGKFDSGIIAEKAWVDVMEEYFGEQFDIHQDVPIHHLKERLPKFDIILTKKDRSHRTPAITDYIDSQNVVAAFEVKRTLKKIHIDIRKKESKDIFDSRCSAIKKILMPMPPAADQIITPYQLLRGKVFFGILSLDVEEGVKELLLSEKSRADTAMFTDTAISAYSADIIICPGKLLWAKKNKFGIVVNSISLDLNRTTHFVEEENNNIDISVSSFGYLIASMRRFFVAQGHITETDAEEYLDPYRHFELLPSAHSKSRSTWHDLDGKTSKHLIDIAKYLRSEDEYLNKSLDILSSWPINSMQDIIISLKHSLQKKLGKNQPLLAEGKSFDNYFNSLFKN